NGKGGKTANGSQPRGGSLPPLESVKPTNRRRQGSASGKDRSAKRPASNFWGWLLGHRSRRPAQKPKADQANNPTRLRSEAPSSAGGGQASTPVSLPNREAFVTRPKSFAPGLENGKGGSPSGADAAKQAALRSSTLLQLSAQSSIRDRYNQLLPHKPGSGRFGALLPGQNRTSMRPESAQLNGAGVQSINRPSRRERTPSKPHSPGFSAALYAARMVILSVGVGVLAGTMLSMWDPASRSPAGASQQSKQASISANSTTTSGGGSGLDQMPSLGQEMTPLKSALQTLVSKNTQMAAGIFLLDLDKNAYVDLNGDATFSSASTIKVPVLVAFFQDLDAGKVRLDEPLTLRKELVGNGSGDMQYQPPGTRFTVLETITKMITISDNTATNLIIARLGGAASLNQRFKSWGMRSTAINQPLPDLQGTNTTSPRDLAILMTRISQGDLISLRSRDRMLDIMRQTENRSQLPQGLGAGATIAHKTGDIGTMIGDVGLIDVPNGKRYAAVVMVKRSFNDDRAYEFVSQISRLAYQYFTRAELSQPGVTPSVAPTAIPTGSPGSSPPSPSINPNGQSSPNPTSETMTTPNSSSASPSGESEGSNSDESTTN
ncbi:MAG: serine hydrolase, partial [Kovacikia sp.]